MTENTRDHGLLDDGVARDRPHTVLISDLHLAGGPNDPREDHVWRGRPLEGFIDQLAKSEDGRAGRIELIINGDFLEFVQAFPEAYSKGHVAWCSEPESLHKLEEILAGHPGVFEALARLQKPGNAVTVMAGNHDVDLYWPGVRARLREVAGPLRFELGREWYQRYGGRLQIAHGHQLDPANQFEAWANPIGVREGVERLEACPGTLFVVGYVNPMDLRYPFIDNIKPVGRLVPVLLREDPRGAFWATLCLLRFLATSDHGTLLGAEAPGDPMERVLLALREDEDFAGQILSIHTRVTGRAIDLEGLRTELRTATRFEKFLGQVLAHGAIEELPRLAGATLGPGANRSTDGGHLLGLARERIVDVVERLRLAAEERAEKGAEVVVCGHTHVPQEISGENHVYINTGSWTRYLRVGEEATITLEQLRDAESFPYELWAAHVELGEEGRLVARRERVGQSGASPDSPSG